MSQKPEMDVSIIDEQLSVDGKLSTKGRLVVKGEVRGTVEAETLVIAREGRVFADVKVSRMTIGGYFEGEVVATQVLIILATGNCSGKVTCKYFMVEAGGVLNADVTSLS
ncbi:MAG: polymer-forming cytoskeletal protein [Pseudomonadota bacterium]